MALTITVQPVIEPVTLVEAKHLLRLEVDDGTHDELLARLITTAREEVESVCGRSLITRTYQLLVPAADEIELPRPPLGAISAVVSIDEDAVETTIAAADRELDTTPPVPVLAITELPADAVYLKITYTAGYGATVASVPQILRQAVLLRLTQHFMSPEGITDDADSAFYRLAGRYRIDWSF